MKKCPFCAEEIQSEAIKCRYCGEFLNEQPLNSRLAGGYEYRTRAAIAGVPLLHIARGIDPATGSRRIARGVVAVGDIAFGGLAIGGFAVGVVALGGCSLGIAAIGGLALGAASLGGVSLAYYLAVGGVAVSLNYAMGGVALGTHTLSAQGVDPGMRSWLEALGARLQR